jgi:hypothetical protein
MAGFSSVVVGLTIFLIYLLKRLFFGNGTTRTPIPPGPKGLPVLGNINDLPASGKPEFEHWLEHKDQYGPISSVTALGLTMIIMHDKSMVMELMEKRGTKHSGRARMKFAMDMLVPHHEVSDSALTLTRIGWINTIISQQYNKTFRYNSLTGRWKQANNSGAIESTQTNSLVRKLPFRSITNCKKQQSVVFSGG